MRKNKWHCVYCDRTGPSLAEIPHQDSCVSPDLRHALFPGYKPIVVVDREELRAKYPDPRPASPSVDKEK